MNARGSPALTQFPPAEDVRAAVAGRRGQIGSCHPPRDAPDEYGPETFDREPPVLHSSFRLKASSSPAQSCPWWQSGLITRATKGTQSGQIFRTNWHDSAPWYHDVSSLPCDLLVAARRDDTGHEPSMAHQRLSYNALHTFLHCIGGCATWITAAEDRPARDCLSSYYKLSSYLRPCPMYRWIHNIKPRDSTHDSPQCLSVQLRSSRYTIKHRPSAPQTPMHLDMFSRDHAVYLAAMSETV